MARIVAAVEVVADGVGDGANDPVRELSLREGQSILAHRPEIAEAMDSVAAALTQTGTLGPRLTELLRLRIAFHNQCRTCMAVRYAPDEVDETLVCSLERPQEAADLSDRERAALGYADLFATNHLAIDDSVYDGLREHFDEGELVELGITCAYFVGFGRLTATWHIVDYLPDRFREVGSGQPITPWAKR